MIFSVKCTDLHIVERTVKFIKQFVTRDLSDYNMKLINNITTLYYIEYLFINYNPLVFDEFNKFLVVDILKILF